MKKSKRLEDLLFKDIYENPKHRVSKKDFKERMQEIMDQVEMETRLEKNAQCEDNSVKKIKIWVKITDAGDGSARNEWYLTYEKAKEVLEKEQDSVYYSGFSEDCIEEVETYEGSNIHKEAQENDKPNPWEMTEEIAKQNKKSFFQRQL